MLSASLSPQASASAVIANLGQAMAGNIQIKFEISRSGASRASATSTFYATVKALDAGASVAISTPRPLDAIRFTVHGEYLLRVTVDPRDRIAEENESNNGLEELIFLP